MMNGRQIKYEAHAIAPPNLGGNRIAVMNHLMLQQRFDRKLEEADNLNKQMVETHFFEQIKQNQYKNLFDTQFVRRLGIFCGAHMTDETAGALGLIMYNDLAQIIRKAQLLMDSPHQMIDEDILFTALGLRNHLFFHVPDKK